MNPALLTGQVQIHQSLSDLRGQASMYGGCGVYNVWNECLRRIRSSPKVRRFQPKRRFARLCRILRATCSPISPAL